ncbi:DEAD/DEAH box helicase family protein [Carnobacterium maltaromaticum]|uniref:DEAD/DEAH box helicase family protein n=1 Tax=Carnobacterium maltaromaticum TaxID=2751 RepID=UPI00116777F7|nr:hypothetical protein CMA01_13440 [Carnobacterium maltaromaticum]
MTTKARFGNQHPTQSVILPYNESLCQKAIDYYEKTGRKCYDWQLDLLEPIMALDADGLWVHQKFGFSIPRRNGKTEIIYMAELWALEEGLNTLHTAHRISTSHASFEKMKKYLEDMGYVEGDDFNSIKAKGQERLELYATGGVIQFRTRTSSGGLGEGFDLLIIDEAQEYTTEQESALKYTVTDSKNPLTILCGTPPTPVSSGTVFTNFRDKVLSGQAKYSGWAEWSVDDVRDINDIESWYNSNPSMGYHLNERKIEAELGEDKLDHNIQRLGYWPKYNQKSAISEMDWKKIKVNTLPVIKGPLNLVPQMQKKYSGTLIAEDTRGVGKGLIELRNILNQANYNTIYNSLINDYKIPTSQIRKVDNQTIHVFGLADDTQVKLVPDFQKRYSGMYLANVVHGNATQTIEINSIPDNSINQIKKSIEQDFKIPSFQIK